MREHPLYGVVPSGYVIESMLYFVQLLSKLKQGGKLEELEGTYPTGEEALVSTKLCEAIHQSAASGKIIEL